MRASVALPVLVAALLLAAPGSGRAAGPKDGGSEKQRIAALPEDDRKWLDFVAPILLPEEKKAFLELSSAGERDAFREAFWKRREQVGLRRPMGPGYRDRYRELVAAAAASYDG